MDTSEEFTMTPLEEAIWLTAKEYKDGNDRGAKALAARINARPGTFSNKCDPGMPEAVININEALAMMLVAHDYRILQVLGEETGNAIVPLPKTEFPGDMDLLSAWAEWDVEKGESSAAIKSALEDGAITHAEIAKIKREGIEDFQKFMALVKVLEGMAEPEDKVTPIRKTK